MQCAGGFKTVYVGNAKIINFPKAGRTGAKNCWKVGQAGAARHPENTWVPYTSGIGGSWLELHHQYSSAQHCGEKFPEWVLRLPIRPRVLGMRNGIMRKAQLLSLSEESVYVQLKGLLGDFTQPSTWWTPSFKSGRKFLALGNQWRMRFNSALTTWTGKS